MQIKRTPQDFIVTEIPSRVFADEGRYFVYTVTCTDVTTHTMQVRLASVNNMSSRDIRYAGNKDRRAVTTQYITSPKELRSVDDDIVLEHVGFTDDHLHLGELEANRFEIAVYDVTETRDVHIPNYFGDQRFSSENVEIGLLFVRGKFLEAAQRLRGQYKEIDEHLHSDENDGIGAIRRAPQHSMLMYVHSVQSWLFNEAVSNYVRENFDSYEETEYRHGKLVFPHEELPQKQVPLIGAAQPLGEWEKYYAPLLREHRIGPSNFYIRSLPFLTQEGTTRSLRSEMKDLSVLQEGDKVTVRVTLGTGCYATVVLAGLLV